MTEKTVQSFFGTPLHMDISLFGIGHRQPPQIGAAGLERYQPQADSDGLVYLAHRRLVQLADALL